MQAEEILTPEPAKPASFCTQKFFRQNIIQTLRD